jgi:hypothetical protein
MVATSNKIYDSYLVEQKKKEGLRQSRSFPTLRKRAGAKGVHQRYVYCSPSLPNQRVFDTRKAHSYRAREPSKNGRLWSEGFDGTISWKFAARSRMSTM